MASATRHKVLWLAPWFRTLAVAWGNGLRDRGHEVLVVTTPAHFDAPPLEEGDIELRSPWRSRAGLQEMRNCRRLIEQFAPSVVVGEHARDPRFAQLTPRGVPLIVTTHDHRPHDAANRTPVMRRLTTGRLLSRADQEVVFSHFVEDRLGFRGHPVSVIPLTSEMPQWLVPSRVVPADQRRDFVVVGRLSQYKNLPFILAAFDRHRQSSAFRGDRLVVLGDGDPGCSLPDHVLWRRERFSFRDLAPILAAAKASLCVYLQGSQSGVQVTGMQCGTATLASDVGGLPEYLPPGQTPIKLGDVAALHDALDRLSQPHVAEAEGMASRRLYEARYTVAATSAAWELALGVTIQRR